MGGRTATKKYVDGAISVIGETAGRAVLGNSSDKPRSAEACKPEVETWNW